MEEPATRAVLAALGPGMARFVGGAVRDAILGRPVADIDLAQPLPPEEVLRRAVDFYGADKVMWGSDIGTSSGTYKEMVQRAKDAAALLAAAERRAVLHDTGRRIFDK